MLFLRFHCSNNNAVSGHVTKKKRYLLGLEAEILDRDDTVRRERTMLQ